MVNEISVMIYAIEIIKKKCLVALKTLKMISETSSLTFAELSDFEARRAVLKQKGRYLMSQCRCTGDKLCS